MTENLASNARCSEGTHRSRDGPRPAAATCITTARFLPTFSKTEDGRRHLELALLWSGCRGTPGLWCAACLQPDEARLELRDGVLLNSNRSSHFMHSRHEATRDGGCRGPGGSILLHPGVVSSDHCAMKGV